MDGGVMRDWSHLQEQIQTKKAEPCMWPDSFLPEQQKKFSEFHEYTIGVLDAILQFSIPDDEKEKRLRDFLKLRWLLIQNSSLDYTFNPNLSSNLACLLTAIFLTKQNESACEILMPTVKKIFGSTFSHEKIKDISENSKGDFIPHYFITNHDGSALLHALDIFDRARSTPGILFPTMTALTSTDAETDIRKTIFCFSTEITAADCEQLKKIAGDDSQNYFQLLKKINDAFHKETPSLGYAIKHLCIALIKSSKENNAADAVAVSAECYAPILKFYAYWSALPIATKERIKNYAPEHAWNDIQESLESALLCLFAAIPEIKLTKVEYDRVKKEEIVECTKQLGLHLDRILIHHRDDLFNIPLPGEEAQFHPQALPSGSEINTAFEAIKSAFILRKPLLGLQDDRLIQYHHYVKLLGQYFFDPVFLPVAVRGLASEIHTVADLTQAVLLISPDNLSVLMEPIAERLKKIMRSDDKSWDSFAYLFQNTPIDYWAGLCVELSFKKSHRLLTGRDLSLLMDQFPETEWNILSIAMSADLASSVFLDHHDVVGFFCHAHTGMWNTFYQHFRAPINKVLSTSDNVAKLYMYTDHEDWHYLSIPLHDVLIDHLKTPGFIVKILSSILSPDRKICFIQAISHLLVEAQLDIQTVFFTFKQFRLGQWNLVAETLGKPFFRLLLSNEEKLTAFIKQFENKVEQIICVDALSKLTPLYFKTDQKKLFNLLKNFPEMDKILIKLFLRQLPEILLSFTATFSTLQSFDESVPEEIKIAFNYFVNIGLPILVSLEHIKQCAIDSTHALDTAVLRDEKNPVQILYRKFEEIETQVLYKELRDAAALFKKLELLIEFIDVSEKLACENNLNNAAEKNHLRSRTIFCTELNAAFGMGFFVTMRDNRYRFQVRDLIAPKLQRQYGFMPPPKPLDLHELCIAQKEMLTAAFAARARRN